MSLTHSSEQEDDPASPGRWLLVTDVDNTFLGDDDALEELLASLAEEPQLHLVLNSSRPVPSIQESLAALKCQPRLSGIIGAMGTQILLGDSLDLDKAWLNRFQDWSRDPIDDIMIELGATPHAADMQTPYKASFTVPPGRQPEARRRIEELGMPCFVVTSSETDFDVLPHNAGKGPATLHVLERLKMPHEHLIVAGDSGNDLAMFEIAQKSIAVGNAKPELRDALQPVTTFFAQRPCAGGLLEGLRHWGALRKSP